MLSCFSSRTVCFGSGRHILPSALWRSRILFSCSLVGWMNTTNKHYRLCSFYFSRRPRWMQRVQEGVPFPLLFSAVAWTIVDSPPGLWPSEIEFPVSPTYCISQLVQKPWIVCRSETYFYFFNLSCTQRWCWKNSPRPVDSGVLQTFHIVWPSLNSNEDQTMSKIL